ncbi:periplasmic sensor Signal transduction histidine kinase, partial [mine drainage metagenome]
MLSYALSALAYAVLLAVCLTVWRQRVAGSGIVTAVVAQVGWSIVVAVQAGHLGEYTTALVIAAEYLRDLAWALVLIRCLSGSRPSAWAHAGQRGLTVLVVAVIVWTVGSMLPGEPGVLARQIERFWVWGAFVLAIGGLVLVEQVARNTRDARRYNLKFIWLAIGAIYAWDLCLYSVAMLHGSLAQTFWTDRGFVNAALAVLLALGLNRISAWEAATFLSPRVVFFNATLLGASLYVLVMALGSYFVRRLGGSWGEAGQMLFLGIGALMLIVAALSEQFRAWARVTFAKYFFPYRYDYRSEWQKLTRALSERDDTPFYDRIVRVMAGFLSATRRGVVARRTGRAATHRSAGSSAPPDRTAR